MKSLLVLLLALVLFNCSGPSSPIDPECLVNIQVVGMSWTNPYSSLNVMMDMDSVVRIYNRDTIDTLPVPLGEKIALLFYRSSSPDSLVWVPVKVDRDTTVFFNGKKITMGGR